MELYLCDVRRSIKASLIIQPRQGGSGVSWWQQMRGGDTIQCQESAGQITSSNPARDPSLARHMAHKQYSQRSPLNGAGSWAELTAEMRRGAQSGFSPLGPGLGWVFPRCIPRINNTELWHYAPTIDWCQHHPHSVTSEHLSLTG